MTVVSHHQTVGVRELKAHLSQYLRAVKAGERVEVTERGKVVAILSAPPVIDEVELPARLRQLIAEGRVTPAKRRDAPMSPFQPARASMTVAEILDEDRGDE